MTTATAQNGHKLRISQSTRAQLERDLAEMKSTLQALEAESRLTRSDVGRLEGKIDKILKVVLTWKRGPSALA